MNPPGETEAPRCRLSYVTASNRLRAWKSTWLTVRLCLLQINDDGEKKKQIADELAVEHCTSQLMHRLDPTSETSKRLRKFHENQELKWVGTPFPGPQFL